ncbi:type II toxin-antitoxin system mRNA interferase toxin, RelE/StbE family [Geomonas sp. Red32]|uniref:type II toxin-antitoxin system RelE/ParE family toxin n=1 Tax=Geomonas sp. Red32 TaxID=2912856 RepID=UPI00202CF5F7|nr:type II toxin-antitoxin system mRNA interferase toxin, RelE/StbE family [Geomonas sp. Red32]MCM0080973.1 type II toxin-antitoxin system mRNA interferase toxin, RelE/StbE family [Geomonas sp. Red32]
MYIIATPEQFLRQARRFFKKHPDLRPPFAKVISQLQEDPFQPALALHPLSGKLSGCHAVRLTYSYRITLTILITEKEIILLDIGSHDELYR